MSILEVVVYLCLMVIMSLSLGRIVLQTDRYISFSSQTLNLLLEKHLFFDRLRRDMMCANYRGCYWDSPNLVFRVGNKDIGFYIKNKKIFRLKGVYDFDDRVWVKKSSRVCCVGVAAMNWRLERTGDEVTGVWVTCGSDCWFVKIRAGRYLL